jgi:hypothetical protein
MQRNGVCFVVVVVVEEEEHASAALYAALETLDARPEALHDLTDAPHLVELDLQLVDFAQDGPEARDLGVGILEGVAGAVGLQRRGRLRLLGELCACEGQQRANATRVTRSPGRRGDGRAAGDGRRT